MVRELLWFSITGKIPCMFQKMTGLYCPGCGGTRAVKALLKGKILLSFFYHPLVFYGTMIALLFIISYAIYWKTGKEKYRLYLENGYIYVGLGILTVNFIVKNYFLLVKGIDLLSMLPSV